MAEKRNTYVTVHNPETGESKTFAPDDELPDWASDAITNPDVHDTEEKEQAPVPGPSQSVDDLIGEPEKVPEAKKASAPVAKKADEK
jgi:hypothetical protein